MRRPRAPFLAVLGLAVVALPGAERTDPLAPMRAAFLARINRMRPAGQLLSLSPVLCRVAQARAEDLARSGRNPRDASLAEVADSLTKAGYEPRLLSEIFVEAEGDVAMVLSQSLEREGPLAREVAREKMRDLGIGFALRGDEPPLYVFLFGLGFPDFLAERRADLGDLARVRRELLDRINRERARSELAPLRPDPRLDAAAQQHAEDMLARSFYGHESPEGKTALDRSKAAGYRPRLVGENLAQGQDSIQQVVAAWMDSAVHREHILSPVFADIGSGVAIGTNVKGHQILWVQVFGRSK